MPQSNYTAVCGSVCVCRSVGQSIYKHATTSKIVDVTVNKIIKMD